MARRVVVDNWDKPVAVMSISNVAAMAIFAIDDEDVVVSMVVADNDHMQASQHKLKESGKGTYFVHAGHRYYLQDFMRCENGLPKTYVGKKCMKGFELQVMHSGAGYYLGTIDPMEGPNCRVSGYASNPQQAMNLKPNRICMENDFCNGGCGCQFK